MAHHVREELWPHRINQFDVGIYGNFGQANYGAAKMGMLGLINVLAIEGIEEHSRQRLGSQCGHATDCHHSRPGRSGPGNFDADVHPKLVTRRCC